MSMHLLETFGTARSLKMKFGKDEVKEIVLTWKGRPHVCLALYNKICGRTAEVSKLCVTVFTVSGERRRK